MRYEHKFIRYKYKREGKETVGFDSVDYGNESNEGRGRKRYIYESTVNYTPDDPDIETELAFLGEGKRFDPNPPGACQLSRQVLR